MKQEIIITKKELGSANIVLKLDSKAVKKLAEDKELISEGYLVYIKYPGFVKYKGGTK